MTTAAEGAAARHDPVLILAPAGRDAVVAQAVLAEAGIAAAVCEALDELVAGLDRAGAVVVAEEALLRADRRSLAEWLASQPLWSDLPVILLTQRGEGGADRRLTDILGNVTLLERPFHPGTLVSAVRAALRARARQREAEAHLRELARAQAALREETRSLETLNRVGALLAAELDLERLLQAATDAATELAGARFGAFFYDAPDPEDGRYALCTLSGAPREALAHLPVSWVTTLLHSAFRGPIRIADALRDARHACDAPDGGVRADHLSARSYLAVPVVSRSGEPIGGMVLGHPEPGVFTERAERLVAGVAAQAAIAVDNARLFQEARRAAETLERRVSERTRALEEANAKLREEVAAREAAQVRLAQAQKMEALGQLAGGIAHDFNNVLQTVMSALRLIARSADDARRVRQLAGMATEATERGASVTRRLLAFARRGELRAETVDAAALLADLCEVLAHTLGAGIEVRVKAAAGLPPLRADRGQLEAVLVNLATNARDAMPRGGIVTLSAAPEMVDEAAAAALRQAAGLAPGAYVRMSVADTGTGMDAATLARAAEPFFTTKPLGKGTGLGLAMAKGFAEQSGGALAIESEAGVGTTVTLWLPCAATVHAVQPAEAETTPEGDDTQRPTAVMAAEEALPRIMLVDDEPLVRGALAAELRARGWQVSEAPSAATALLRLGAATPLDLLVTDLSMPGMDGLALVTEARRRRPGLPAMVVTGYMGDDAALALQEAEEGGPFALLRKPVSAEELMERAATLLTAASAGYAA